MRKVPWIRVILALLLLVVCFSMIAAQGLDGGGGGGGGGGNGGGGDGNGKGKDDKESSDNPNGGSGGKDKDKDKGKGKGKGKGEGEGGGSEEGGSQSGSGGTSAAVEGGSGVFDDDSGLRTFADEARKLRRVIRPMTNVSVVGVDNAAFTSSLGAAVKSDLRDELELLRNRMFNITRSIWAVRRKRTASASLVRTVDAYALRCGCFSFSCLSSAPVWSDARRFNSKNATIWGALNLGGVSEGPPNGTDLCVLPQPEYDSKVGPLDVDITAEKFENLLRVHSEDIHGKDSIQKFVNDMKNDALTEGNDRSPIDVAVFIKTFVSDHDPLPESSSVKQNGYEIVADQKSDLFNRALVEPFWSAESRVLGTMELVDNSLRAEALENHTPIPPELVEVSDIILAVLTLFIGLVPLPFFIRIARSTRVWKTLKRPSRIATILVLMVVLLALELSPLVALIIREFEAKRWVGYVSRIGTVMSYPPRSSIPDNSEVLRGWSAVILAVGTTRYEATREVTLLIVFGVAAAVQSSIALTAVYLTRHTWSPHHTGGLHLNGTFQDHALSSKPYPDHQPGIDPDSDTAKPVNGTHGEDLTGRKALHELLTNA